MERATYSVEGMSCTGCETNVERAVGNVPGVTGAEADHERGALTVEADESVADDQVADAVADAGYRVLP